MSHVFDLETACHGGNCCGIDHIWGFEDVDSEDFTFAEKIKGIEFYVEQRIAQHGSDWDFNLDPPSQAPKRLCIEIVLADYQWSTWERAVQRCGFKRVFEFVNSNSGNTCRVYLFASNQPEKPKKQKPLKGE